MQSLSFHDVPNRLSAKNLNEHVLFVIGFI